MFRRGERQVEVFLVHPGGPFWLRRDKGAWTVPKGELEEGEDALSAARREFGEETGFGVRGPFHELGTVKQKGGKLVTAWAFEGDADPKELRSNLFTMEWPPRSGKWVTVPEVDRGAWFTFASAREYLLPSQIPFLEELETLLKGGK